MCVGGGGYGVGVDWGGNPQMRDKAEADIGREKQLKRSGWYLRVDYNHIVCCFDVPTV